ncbi:MAG: methylated-DNA--[protein]-cysteine S-methyltransferase [Burkholderiaceae bacterium]
MTQPMHDTNVHYILIARAIEYIRAEALHQPSLQSIAAQVGLSQYHFQRLFAKWAGVSPKRFLQYVTKEHAKEALRRSADVLDAALSVGLSTPSRLHDLIVTCEAMTPGELKSGGAGVTIGYGHVHTPFGNALVGWTPRGVCHFQFCDGDDSVKLAGLTACWPDACLSHDPTGAAALAATIFSRRREAGRLHLILRGTNFQIKVWEALLQTRPGQILSYSQLALKAGVPNASRAVGCVMAANMLGFLIPCHRVIRGDGTLGDYRWGVTRKAALLAWESALQPATCAGPRTDDGI